MNNISFSAFIVLQIKIKWRDVIEGRGTRTIEATMRSQWRCSSFAIVMAQNSWVGKNGLPWLRWGNAKPTFLLGREEEKGRIETDFERHVLWNERWFHTDYTFPRSGRVLHVVSHCTSTHPPPPPPQGHHVNKSTCRPEGDQNGCTNVQRLEGRGDKRN